MEKSDKSTEKPEQTSHTQGKAASIETGGVSLHHPEAPAILRETRNYYKGVFYILLIALIVLITAVLKITASFVLPLLFSLMLSFVFYPFVNRLYKTLRIPWVLGVLIVVALSIAVFLAVGNLLYSSFKTVIGAYSRYEARFSTVYSLIASAFNLPFDESSSLATNLWNSLGVRNFVQRFAVSASSYMISFLRVVFVVTLFVIFFLIEIRSMRVKVVKAFPERKMNRKILFIITVTMAKVTRYISIKFLISLFTGFTVFFCTQLVGLDFSVIWGFLAFLLNFIPTFGSIVSWALTTAFAVLQFYPSIKTILFVSVAVLAVNMILGNVIEPRWEGSDLGISPFLILAGLSLWGWVWGFMGMLLSVPVMVIIKIVCENISILNPIAVFLGTKKTRGKKRRFTTNKKHG